MSDDLLLLSGSLQLSTATTGSDCSGSESRAGNEDARLAVGEEMVAVGVDVADGGASVDGRDGRDAA